MIGIYNERNLGFLEKWRERLYNNFIVGTVLMDLSKIFDCIFCNFKIPKLAACGYGM